MSASTLYPPFILFLEFNNFRSLVRRTKHKKSNYVGNVAPDNSYVFFPGIFRRWSLWYVERLFRRAIGDGYAEKRKVKNEADQAEHCVLIDVSNPGRIVPVEINGTLVKKQNTCLCCRFTHRR